MYPDITSETASYRQEGDESEASFALDSTPDLTSHHHVCRGDACTHDCENCNAKKLPDDLTLPLPTFEQLFNA